MHCLTNKMNFSLVWERCAHFRKLDLKISLAKRYAMALLLATPPSLMVEKVVISDFDFLRLCFSLAKIQKSTCDHVILNKVWELLHETLMMIQPSPWMLTNIFSWHLHGNFKFLINFCQLQMPRAYSEPCQTP